MKEGKKDVLEKHTQKLVPISTNVAELQGLDLC